MTFYTTQNFNASSIITIPLSSLVNISGTPGAFLDNYVPSDDVVINNVTYQASLVKLGSHVVFAKKVNNANPLATEGICEFTMDSTNLYITFFKYDSNGDLASVSITQNNGYIFSSGGTVGQQIAYPTSILFTYI
jgi:hypothetical protein